MNNHHFKYPLLHGGGQGFESPLLHSDNPLFCQSARLVFHFFVRFIIGQSAFPSRAVTVDELPLS